MIPVHQWSHNPSFVAVTEIFIGFIIYIILIIIIIIAIIMIIIWLSILSGLFRCWAGAVQATRLSLLYKGD